MAGRCEIEKVPDGVVARFRSARVARLATVDPDRSPHLIPICYAFERDCFYTAIDSKPKRTPAQNLTRLRNIEQHAQVAILIDEYDEDWSRLWYVLVRGVADLLQDGEERGRALDLLRAKYPAYRSGLLPEDSPLIRIRAGLVNWWGKV